MTHKLRPYSICNCTTSQRDKIMQIADNYGIFTKSNGGCSKYLAVYMSAHRNGIVDVMQEYSPDSTLNWMMPDEFAQRTAGCEPIAGVTIDDVIKLM